MKKKVNESAFDNLLASLGNQSAQGRLDNKELYNKIRNVWTRYLSRSKQEPSVEPLEKFLYDIIGFNEDDIENILHKSNINTSLLKLTNNQINNVFKVATKYAFSNNLVDVNDEKDTFGEINSKGHSRKPDHGTSKNNVDHEFDQLHKFMNSSNETDNQDKKSNNNKTNPKENYDINYVDGNKLQSIVSAKFNNTQIGIAKHDVLTTNNPNEIIDNNVKEVLEMIGYAFIKSRKY